MRLSSIQRRHESYKILYIYKIKAGLLPNLPPHPLKQESFTLKFRYNPKMCITCILPNHKQHHLTASTARKCSFALTASKLWNCLPACVSNISKLPLHIFKHKLDKFLDIFPDELR